MPSTKSIGTNISDDNIEETVMGWIGYWEKNESLVDFRVTVGNGTFVLCLRTLVAEGVVSHKDVEILYKGFYGLQSFSFKRCPR